MFLRSILDKVIYDDSKKEAKIIGEIPIDIQNTEFPLLWTNSTVSLYRGGVA